MTVARLKEKYQGEIRPQLKQELGYKNIEQVPKLEKIVLNMGVGDAKQDTSMLESSIDQLAKIAGQRPSVRRAKKSVAGFKVRDGMPVGVAVTVRRERMYELLDRIIAIAIPRIRDFRGLNPRSFDGRGNYSFGIEEQIVFPEVDYDSIDQIRGLDVTITTSAKTDSEAQALLVALGVPLRKDTGEERAAEAEAAKAKAEKAEAEKAKAKARAEEAEAAAAKAAEDEVEGADDA